MCNCAKPIGQPRSSVYNQNNNTISTTRTIINTNPRTVVAAITRPQIVSQKAGMNEIQKQQHFERRQALLRGLGHL